MALAADVKIIRYGVPGNSTQPQVPGPIAASTTLYGGSICLTNSSGNVKSAASPSSADTCWGLVHAQTINASTNVTTGIALDVNGRPFEVETGAFFLASATGADALNQTYVGKTVYVYDEVTVAATNGSNTRPAAGVLLGIDTTQGGGYAVKLGSNETTGA